MVNVGKYTVHGCYGVGKYSHTWSLFGNAKTPRLASKWESTTWPTVLGLSLLHMVTWGVCRVADWNRERWWEINGFFYNVGSRKMFFGKCTRLAFWKSDSPTTPAENVHTFWTSNGFGTGDIKSWGTFTCQVRKFTWQVGKMEGWLQYLIFFLLKFGGFHNMQVPAINFSHGFLCRNLRWTQKSGWVYRMYLEGGPYEWWTGVMAP